ncbi:MAG: ribonuclease HIII [Methanosphaera sp.]|nr:ribonuclease HIII [Methanosphaera sp.]
MKSTKLNKDEINRFRNITKSLRHKKPHQYESVRIKDGKVVLILYDSGKLVYNDNDESFRWVVKVLDDNIYQPTTNYQPTSSGDYQPTNTNNYQSTTNKNINSNHNNYVDFMDNYEYTIGSDETGKGEWYGPLVISAVCTSNSQNRQLKEIGVGDSKSFNHNQINRLYKKIKDIGIMNETIILKPFSYNNLYNKFRSENKNLNHLLAYLHSKAISRLLSQINTTDVLVIIDKFDYKKMNSYLDINSNIKVIQESNGEKYIPVATSSIIAKYHYEKTLKEIEKRYNINLRKTKPSKIDKDILSNVAKTHFKNVSPYTK